MFKERIKKWWNELGKSEIMTINYNLETNKIVCKNWCSETIYPFCGTFSVELFQSLKPYCRFGKFPNTRIYIWAGMEKKYIAYNKPVEKYFAMFTREEKLKRILNV